MVEKLHNFHLVIHTRTRLMLVYDREIVESRQIECYDEIVKIMKTLIAISDKRI